MFGKARPGTGAVNAAMISRVRRQYVDDGDGELVWFWYTKEGVIIKWVVFLTIIVLFGGWIVGGRIHAKRRMRKGLKPMAYHGWLLSRQERATVDPQYAWPQAQYQPAGQGPAPGYYGMQPMPPPVYDPNHRPPMYEGDGVPQQHSKVDPSQAGPGAYGNAPEYSAPPGPPPSAAFR
ncbi:Uu.00g030590.m01.CDS01 [Anthostomella pinea]|uniref:Uu.00g030590.m01.CDS01 n=1 Tax=Anthostomella pinea TaxID=933095 RepID=A0AAI8YCX1_9PEZI|nr:Uu.00g030590.m01.CDS01 [Anthostomella pinea]